MPEHVDFIGEPKILQEQYVREVLATHGEPRQPLRAECCVSIAISAFNEGHGADSADRSNLELTIEQVWQQTQTHGVPTCRYEVIVVDNDSTDDTQQVLASFTQRYPQLQLSHYFESRRGIKYAKKRAMDQAMLHQLRRAQTNTGVGIIASIDADTRELPANWLSDILNLTGSGVAGGYAGIYKFDTTTDELLPNATTILYEQYDLYESLWNIFGRMTPGGNSGIDPVTYAQIGGYTQPFAHAGDLHVGTKIINLGKQIHELAAPVRVDGRRLRIHPAAFVAGKSYEKILEHDYHTTSFADIDLRSEDLGQFRALRLHSTVQNQFLLQCVLKPGTVFDERNEEELARYLGDEKELRRLQHTLMHSNRSRIEDLTAHLMSEHGESVFHNMKELHPKYRTLNYPKL